MTEPKKLTNAELQKQVEHSNAEVERLKGLVVDIGEMMETLKEQGSVVGAGGLSVAQVAAIVKDQSAGDRPHTGVPLTGKAREELDAIDPLGKIDEKCQEIRLIGRTGSVPLRQARQTASGMVIRKRRMRSEWRRIWMMCPYIFGGKTADDMQANMFQNKEWHVFVFTRHHANEMWSGRHGFPVEAPITFDDFEGCTGSDPQGHMRQTSGISMREGLRRLLQQNQRMLFLDTDYYSPNYDGRLQHQYGMANKPQVDQLPELIGNMSPYEPNPYSISCDGATDKLIADMPIYGPSVPLMRGYTAEVDNPAALAEQGHNAGARAGVGGR